MTQRETWKNTVLAGLANYIDASHAGKSLDKIQDEQTGARTGRFDRTVTADKPLAHPRQR
jgi:hypothetical protein